MTASSDSPITDIPPAASTRVPDCEQGGEGPCLMARVCPECGRLADEDPPTRCENCQAEINPA
jgi:hypothetical protein